MVITDDAGILHTHFSWSSVFQIMRSETQNCHSKVWQHFSVSSCSDSMSTPSPHLCVLKREEGESYGFHLRVERGHQGHIIRNVVSGGVAGRSGLKDGDRLLEVNNCFVDDVLHSEVKWPPCIIELSEASPKNWWESNSNYCISLFMNQVARKITLSRHQLCLLVLDGEKYEQAVSRGEDLRGLVMAYKCEGCKPPRLCHIIRDPVTGLGINFTPMEGNHEFKVRD